MIYICMNCFMVKACKFGDVFQLCETCHLNTSLPCKGYKQAKKVILDYECEVCRINRIKNLN